MNNNDIWTPHQEQMLLEICQHTHRIGDIAHALEPFRNGVSRNSVIGKIARLRRAGHLIATGPPGGGYPEQAKRRKVRNPQSFARVEVLRMSTLPKQEPRPPEPAPFTMRLITLLELGHRTCRWPLGDDPPYLFCGNPTDPERVYCPVHHIVAHGR